MFIENSIQGSDNGVFSVSDSRPQRKGTGNKISTFPVQKNGNNWSCSTLDNAAEDAVICILSFLSPAEISACSCLNKRLRGLCSDDRKVWLAMCERRWGSRTNVQKWGNGKIRFKKLYEILKKWENLVGFWRGVGHGGNGPLIVFDWGSYYVIASRIMAVRPGSYEVCKVPFLWMGVSQEGKYLSFINPEWLPDSTICKSKEFKDGSSSISNSDNVIENASNLSQIKNTANGFGASEFSENGVYLNKMKNPFENSNFIWDFEDLVPEGLVSVNLSFVGNFHIVVEENQSWVRTYQAQAASFGRSNSYSDFSKKKGKGLVNDLCQPGSAPDSLQSEVYQYFANKVSPGGDRAARKQRRKEKERAASQGRKKWEAEHFVKIVHCFPTPARPLQGLWKGICDSMGLEFILVSYDEFGGIVCRKVGEFSPTLSGYGSVFWTANCTSFVGLPLSTEEEELYNCRTHIRPLNLIQTDGSESILSENEEVTQVLCINPNSDLFGHNFRVPTNIEGRVWQYANGKFGFGFLHKTSIVDYIHIGSSGCLLDTH